MKKRNIYCKKCRYFSKFWDECKVSTIKENGKYNKITGLYNESYIKIPELNNWFPDHDEKILNKNNDCKYYKKALFGIKVI